MLYVYFRVLSISAGSLAKGVGDLTTGSPWKDEQTHKEELHETGLGAASRLPMKEDTDNMCAWNMSPGFAERCRSPSTSLRTKIPQTENRNTNKQTTKQTSKQTNKPASEQANNQANKANKQVSKHPNKQVSKQPNKQELKQATKQASKQTNKPPSEQTNNQAKPTNK